MVFFLQEKCNLYQDRRESTSLLLSCVTSFQKGPRGCRLEGKSHRTNTFKRKRGDRLGNKSDPETDAGRERKGQSVLASEESSVTQDVAATC